MPPQRLIETILYGLGTVAGVIGVLVFAFSTELPISPVTDIVLTTAVGVALFITAQGFDSDNSTLAAYIIGIAAAGGAALEAINIIDGGPLAIVGLFALIAVTFFGLARWVQSGKLRPLEQKDATRYAITGIVIMVVVAIAAVDVIGGGVSASTELRENVTIEEGQEELVVGSYTLSNQGLLPRAVDEPRYEACLVGDWNTPNRDPAIPVNADSLSTSLLGGGEEDSGSIRVFIPQADDSPIERGSITVTTATSCPTDGDNSGERQIVIYQSGGTSRPSPP